MGMEIIAGKKVSFTFAISIPSVFARFLREDFIEIKNKEWNAREKPEEISLRSTLASFKCDFCFFREDNDFTIKCGEFYCDHMVF